MAQHNVPVLDVCWGRQALSQGIRYHEMGTERHEFDDACGHHIANEVTADINVTGELATNRIFRHGDTGQIIFVDMRRSSLSIAEIAMDLAHVVHFLSAVTGRNIFSFRGGERYAVLTT